MVKNLNEGKIIRSWSIGFPTLSVIMALCAYFVYGQVMAAASGVLLIGLVLGFIAYVGLVPFGGAAIYWLIGGKLLIPKVLAWAGISYAWPIAVLFWVNFAFALLLTVVTTIMAIEVIADLSR